MWISKTANHNALNNFSETGMLIEHTCKQNKTL